MQCERCKQPFEGDTFVGYCPGCVDFHRNAKRELAAIQNPRKGMHLDGEFIKPDAEPGPKSVMDPVTRDMVCGLCGSKEIEPGFGLGTGYGMAVYNFCEGCNTFIDVQPCNDDEQGYTDPAARRSRDTPTKHPRPGNVPGREHHHHGDDFMANEEVPGPRLADLPEPAPKKPKLGKVAPATPEEVAAAAELVAGHAQKTLALQTEYHNAGKAMVEADRAMSVEVTRLVRTGVLKSGFSYATPFGVVAIMRNGNCEDGDEDQYRVMLTKQG